MLTRSQTSLHWRTWSHVTKVNSWKEESGRMVDESSGTSAATILHKLCWRDAARLAHQESRAIRANDLRHASYMVATRDVAGWPKNMRPVASMSDLGNRTFSRVLVLWALLIDSDDIDATIKWEHPEISEREGLLISIARRAPEGVLRAISANAFHTKEWQNLEDIDDLRHLSRIIAEKKHHHHRALTPVPCPLTPIPSSLPPAPCSLTPGL